MVGGGVQFPSNVVFQRVHRQLEDPEFPRKSRIVRHAELVAAQRARRGPPGCAWDHSGHKPVLTRPTSASAPVLPRRPSKFDRRAAEALHAAEVKALRVREAAQTSARGPGLNRAKSAVFTEERTALEATHARDMYARAADTFAGRRVEPIGYSKNWHLDLREYGLPEHVPPTPREKYATREAAVRAETPRYTPRPRMAFRMPRPRTAS